MVFLYQSAIMLLFYFLVLVFKFVDINSETCRYLVITKNRYSYESEVIKCFLYFILYFITRFKRQTIQKHL